MRISTIAFANLKRRKGKAIFLTIGIAIGVGTAVALLSLSTSIKEEIGCLRGHTGSVAALECKDKVLVSAGYDTTVRVWDVGDQVAAGGGAGPGRVGARPAEPRTR